MDPCSRAPPSPRNAPPPPTPGTTHPAPMNECPTLTTQPHVPTAAPTLLPPQLRAQPAVQPLAAHHQHHVRPQHADGVQQQLIACRPCRGVGGG